jgi:general secretion pathway protein A
MGAYGRGRLRVPGTLVRRAAREALRGSAPRRGIGPIKPALAWAALTAGIIMLGVGLYLSYGALTPVLPAVAEAETHPTPPLAEPTEAATPAVGRAPSPPSPAPDGPPRIVSAAELQALLAHPASAEQLWPRLSALWGEAWPAEAPASPCAHLQTVGLRCLSGRGDGDELRRYNRPALLRLTGSAAGGWQAVLRALDGYQATLLIGADTVRTDLNALGALWNGEYLLLWRPEITPKFIGPGAQGDAVTWLRQRLALAQGQAVAGDALSQVFDPTLQDQVRRFQKLNALEADGLVGQRTLALLNNLAPTPDTPLLTAPAH